MKLRLEITLMVLLASTTGCMTTHTLNARLQQIKGEHNVTVRADNPLSRCYLFGYLPGLLDRIDADLDKCPQYFKDNIGPVLIQETFLDNPSTYPLAFMVRGYVDLGEQAEGFPIHIKNRSLFEKALLWAPRDGELFLHEATHSFEANVRADNRGRWEEFKRQFDTAQRGPYGGITALLGFALVPPLAYVRPPGVASFYGWVDHWEDVAETHCYLRRHGGDVEILKTQDKILYSKCQIVGELTRGNAIREEYLAKRIEDSGDVLERSAD